MTNKTRWGLKWGLGFAFFASAFYLLLVLVTWLGGGDLQSHMGVGAWAVLGAYWIGLPTGGVLVGWLRPWARRSNLGSAIAGIVAAIPAYGTAIVALEGPAAFADPTNVLELAILVVLFGPIGGIVIRKVAQRKHGENRSSH